VNLTLFIFDDILKNEMWYPVCDELWFILYFIYMLGKQGVTHSILKSLHESW